MGAGGMEGRREENGCAVMYSFTPVFCREGDGELKSRGWKTERRRLHAQRLKSTEMMQCF